MISESLRAFIDNQIEKRPIEATIARKVIRALKAAGTPVVSIYDGEEDEDVTTEREMLDIIFNLDECWLHAYKGGFVYLVMGQGYDMIADYNVSLEGPLKPVNDWIDKKEMQR